MIYAGKPVPRRTVEAHTELMNHSRCSRRAPGCTALCLGDQFLWQVSIAVPPPLVA